ncbi:MAG: LicD family protein [Bacilli bacterium]|nr:LicD family protein [Bacilli bacterium]
MKEIHKIILDIFKEVSKICEENKISYFAIGGTCLGAIRHKGFIPWDDDLDIAIPIEDYQRFIDICKKCLPPKYTVFVPRDFKHNNLNFIKIIDNTTMLTQKEFMQWKETYSGVWIDVMPISGVPTDSKKRNRFIKKAWIHEWIGYKEKASMKNQRKLIGKIAWIACRLPYYVFPKEYQWDKWMKMLLKYPLNESQYTGYVWSKNLKRLIFPTEWFSTTIDVKFEDTTIKCPIGWHEYLTQMFGDYMKLPPEEKRTSGHDFDGGCVDLKHSYKDYQDGKYEIRRD